jgi:hypothetical protein
VQVQHASPIALLNHLCAQLAELVVGFLAQRQAAHLRDEDCRALCAQQHRCLPDQRRQRAIEEDGRSSTVLLDPALLVHLHPVARVDLDAERRVPLHLAARLNAIRCACDEERRSDAQHIVAAVIRGHRSAAKPQRDCDRHVVVLVVLPRLLVLLVQPVPEARALAAREGATGVLAPIVVAEDGALKLVAADLSLRPAAVRGLGARREAQIEPPWAVLALLGAVPPRRDLRRRLRPAERAS